MSWFFKPFAQLIAPMSPERFTAELMGQQPARFPGDPLRFAELFDWQELNDLLNLGLEQPPGIRLVKDQLNFVFRHKDASNTPEILRLLQQGATLVLENVERSQPQLSRLLDALSAELLLDCHFNLYLSYPGQIGYPIHYDSHDFLILQIAGSKKWQIFEKTLSDAQIHPQAPRHNQPEWQNLIQTHTLTAGDVLYVPKGFWHQVQAEHEPSLHLTLGLYPDTGIDFLRWLQEQAQTQDAFCKSWPWGPEAGAIETPLQAVKSALEQLLNQPDLLQRYQTQREQRLQRRQIFQLPHLYTQQPWQLEAATHFEVRQQPVCLQLLANGQLELSYTGAQLLFDPAASPLLQELLKGPSFTLAELEQRFAEFKREDLLVVLLPLVQDGLIQPIFPQQPHLS